MPITWQTITDEYQIPANFEALNTWGPDVQGSMRAQIVAVGVDGYELYYRTRGDEVLGPFPLPPGDQGETGPPGPANALTIGTVTASAPGGSADAQILGTPPTQTLNLTIPRGEQGIPGAGVSDEDLATYINDPETDTRAALNSWETSILRHPARPRASVTYGLHSGLLYTVLRVHDGLRPGVIAKTFGEGFETAGQSGSNLVPPAEPPQAAQARTGYPIVANGGGWTTTGNVGELIGAHVINGTAVHDFEDANEHGRGREAIGFRSDGTYGVYSALSGHTAASMVADGVINCFGYGPAVVTGGTARDLSAVEWEWIRTQISARQILGITAGGDLLLITITGNSGTSGITGTDAGLLALQEGAYDAIMLDGGGSAQTRVGAGCTMPSSAAACMRPVRDFLLIDAQPSASTVVSPWIPLSYAAGVRARGGDLCYRINGDRFEFKGGAELTAGGALSTGAQLVTTMPFRPAGEILSVGPANGANLTKALVTPAGEFNMYGNGSATYARFEQLTGSYLAGEVA